MSFLPLASLQPQAAGSGRRYWRSLEELADTPQFRRWVEREFPKGASELLASSSRRTLLKLMAASFGLAGMVACRRPEEKILPLSKGVEHYIPGKPLYYATAMSLSGLTTGLLVEAHDGRPTKIEGNPRHPESLGAASAFAQASVLSLYDPDRSRSVLHKGKPSSWEEFSRFAAAAFHPDKLGRGEGLWVLSEMLPSPSLEALRARLVDRFPEARWVEFEPAGRDELWRGAEIAFGRRLETHYDFSRADVIVAFDADFLGLDNPSLRAIREFAGRRAVASEKDSMSRLYVAESRFSITGAMADHRFAIRSSDIAEAVADLAAALGLLGGREPRYSWAPAVARDLAGRRGASIVLAGPGQPAEVHALVHLINEALGNFGKTVSFTEKLALPGESDFKTLAAEMAAGRVNALVILGANPVFTAPADFDFAARFGRIPATVHLGLEADETAALATWHLPQAHYLEAWGDVRTADGTASVQQPLIQPLYGGRTPAEVLALLTGYEHQRAYEIVRHYWLARWPAAEAERRWRRALHDGVIEGSAWPRLTPPVRREAVLAARRPAPPEGIEVVFHPSHAVWDGRFANNGWLEEAPEPMTKLTWDNAALVSPKTASALGVASGDVVTLERGGRRVEMPVWILPGQAENSIAVALGYGRSRCGRVGRGVGHNVYPLRTSDSPGFAAGVTVRPAGRRYQLVSAQDHHSMEGRPLVREASLQYYRQHPDFAKHAVHAGPLESIYPARSYDEGYQWGMAIDLNRCVGCNACILACQAENNIPIVGKREVARGREMHWLRVDRYFSGEPDAPEAVFQPVACMHCENAPCENVCPVAATVHSPEGLNEMAYNRCVGTRYCSNNCPYKVRRFNFLEWHKNLEAPQELVFNPDVTVRMRGVMEKCTYCVQRIQEKKIQAKAEGRRPIRDGEILTACQQTCPAQAIVFGNINDPGSRVSQLKKQNRDYVMLEELNIKPRTSYLARLRNRNPELA
jgi:molybdopterin-containing oxidoreductase family iron-sulfur binding subunit